jgi:hypothetical protein
MSNDSLVHKFERRENHYSSPERGPRKSFAQLNGCGSSNKLGYGDVEKALQDATIELNVHAI